jgi:hypothetical protein
MVHRQPHPRCSPVADGRVQGARPRDREPAPWRVQIERHFQTENAVALLVDFAKEQIGHPHRVSHSGLLEPRGTSTVLKDPGVFDKTTWSVIP